MAKDVLNISEADRVSATMTLTMRRVNDNFREQRRAEAHARTVLAAAIIALDEVNERIAAGEMVHNFQQQADVKIASNRYTQALADYIRGDDPQPSGRS